MENIVSKEQMQSLEVLAKTNMQISEAKSSLFKLKKDEETYIKEREAKALRSVGEVYQKSNDILLLTRKNYEEVHEFHKSASSVVDFIEEVQVSLQSLFLDFKERCGAWENKINSQQKEISQLYQEIKEERRVLERDKKSVETAKKNLERLKNHIESRQSALESSYTIEKKLWDKLTK